MILLDYLLTPFVIAGKVLMRRSLEVQVDEKLDGEAKWDQQLDDNLCMQWDKFFSVLLQLEEVEITRCLKPDNAIGNPELYLQMQVKSHMEHVMWDVMWDGVVVMVGKSLVS